MSISWNAADNPLLTGDATTILGGHKLLRGTTPYDQVNPQFTQLSYGDFQFPAASQIEIEDEPVTAIGGRNLFGRRLRVTVRFLIYTNYPTRDNGLWDLARAGNNTLQQRISCDRAADVVRTMLARPQQNFVCAGFGYGVINIAHRRTQLSDVNDTQAAPANTVTFDIKDGPDVQTQPISFQNLGAEAKIATWTMIAHVPYDFLYYPTNPNYEAAEHHVRMTRYPEDLEYRVSISQEMGYVTRTITGILRRYKSRNTERFEQPLTSDSSVDQNTNQPLVWRHMLDNVFRPLSGFMRTFPLLEQDESRNDLRFTIVDKEIVSDNPYEVGVTRARAPYTIKAHTPFNDWSVNLQVDLEIAPSYPKVWGYYIFTVIFTDLVKRLQDKFFRSRPSKDTGASTADSTTAAQIVSQGQNLRQMEYFSENSVTKIQRKPFTQLLALQLEEDRYDRNLSFSAAWRIMGIELEEILIASGFAQPGTTGADWDRWRSSMDTVLTSHGYQRLGAPVDYEISFDDIEDDISVSQGIGPTTPIPKRPYSTVTLTTQDDLENDARGDGKEKTDKPEKAADEDLGPGEGYVEFRNYLEVRSGATVLAHTRIDDSIENAPVETGTTDDAPSSPFSGEGTTDDSRSRSLVSRAHASKYTAILHGYVMRYSKYPRVPVLRKVGDANAIPTGSLQTGTEIIATTDIDGNVKKVYCVWWAKVYILDKRPTTNTIVADYAVE